ncbi:hypothetical protein KNU79_gp79 [Gordonia phage NadineRae]|uniref:Uncharacterized protein n=1 Tax=Gordonia phage NadineRae TaxID=2652882 RepID=A0A5P8DG62_9CAUD|nr:hypothetical protein KNU79_gp79 [Gordonia phage NadineRae]QFP97761.1 hypothetical protein SEA_NADINERAE_79 [Gordonia phage NadineRae]
MTTAIATRVESGPLRVDVERVADTVATLTAAGYVWQVIADGDDTAPRVRVTCHGRKISRLFDRWQYPRADVWHAVGVAGVRLMTRADVVEIDHEPAGLGAASYVGRRPLPDHERHAVESATRLYVVRDLA